MCLALICVTCELSPCVNCYLSATRGASDVAEVGCVSFCVIGRGGHQLSILAERVSCVPNTSTGQYGYVLEGRCVPVSHRYCTSSTKTSNTGNKATESEEENKENATGCDRSIDPESLSVWELVWKVRGAYHAFRRCVLQRDEGTASSRNYFEGRFAEYLIYGGGAYLNRLLQMDQYGNIVKDCPLQGVVNYPNASCTIDWKGVQHTVDGAKRGNGTVEAKGENGVREVDAGATDYDTFTSSRCDPRG